jgi:GT2 family glycosyltransferase
MSEPLVHVLVINWNGLEHLEACFQSLLTSTYCNVKFILVDNASTDESVAYVQEHFGSDPRVEILQCGRNLGWGGGNNFAMERSLARGADYLFLLNNDTATAPEAIETLVSMAEAHPERGALAPKMLMFYQPEIINSVGLVCSRIGCSWDKGIGRVDTPAWNTPEPVLGVCGGAMFLRSAALAHSGLLPEEFGIYLDDLDLSMRIWNAGWEVWSCPEAVVRHKFSATYGHGDGARRKYYLNTRNRFWLLLRNIPLSKTPIVLWEVKMGEAKALGRALLDGAFWRVAAHLRAYVAALAYLPRAQAERRARRDEGTHACKFWHLIRRRPLFAPALHLPQEGWYPPGPVQGRPLQPMAPHAWIHAATDRLRLIHGNCYPQLGPTRVRVLQNGALVATLSTTNLDELLLETAAGRIDFYADHLFISEATGEPMDIGGWISVLSENESGAQGVPMGDS